MTAVLALAPVLAPVLAPALATVPTSPGLVTNGVSVVAGFSTGAVTVTGFGVGLRGISGPAQLAVSVGCGTNWSLKLC